MKNCAVVSDRCEVQELLEQYQFHKDLNMFRSAKEQQLIMTQMVREDITDVSLAVYGNSIVGYVTLLPPEPDDRWAQLPYIQMLGALEIVPEHRGNGLAKRLIDHLFDRPDIEDMIVISMEYYWHWDLKNTHLNVYEYQRMLKHLLETCGMEQYFTDYPDVTAHPANFMMARIGKNVSLDQLLQFMMLTNPRVMI